MLLRFELYSFSLCPWQYSWLEFQRDPHKNPVMVSALFISDNDFFSSVLWRTMDRQLLQYGKDMWANGVFASRERLLNAREFFTLTLYKNNLKAVMVRVRVVHVLNHLLFYWVFCSSFLSVNASRPLFYPRN